MLKLIYLPRISLFRMGVPCINVGTQRCYAISTSEQEATGDKVLKLRVPAMRLDAIIKSGLGMSRNKVEKAFYEDRVRVNGSRPKKKSQTSWEGDEIDIVRGINKLNPLFIDVNRVEILEAGEGGKGEGDEAEDDTDDEDDEKSARIPVVLKRSKNLTIDNYEIPWKGTTQT